VGEVVRSWSSPCLKHVGENCSPVLGILTEGFHVPRMRHQRCYRLIGQHPHKHKQHRLVADTKDHHETEVDDDFTQIVWTGHILEQSSMGNPVFGRVLLLQRRENLVCPKLSQPGHEEHQHV